MAAVTTLPASFTSGQILTATNMNDLRGAFRVLQVITGSTTVQANSSSATFADTGLTASITPSATSSKVLVIVNQAGCYKTAGNTLMKLKLFRGATELCQFEGYGGFTGGTTVDIAFGSCSTVYLDSPATTSATTYKTQYNSNSGVNGTYVQTANSFSSIALLEISA